MQIRILKLDENLSSYIESHHKAKMTACGPRFEREIYNKNNE
jgi:hypothetical protein